MKDNDPVDIAVAYDAGWQKRGTGRQYNSLTGKFLTKNLDVIICKFRIKVISYCIWSDDLIFFLFAEQDMELSLASKLGRC